MKYNINTEQLIQYAQNAVQYSHCPYSKFKVGAALLTDKGIYCGCNIENSSYSATVCAERTAFYNAVSGGAKEFIAIAVWAGGDTVTPCGVCRQVMSEFCGGDFVIICAKSQECYKTYILSELLPYPFKF